MKASVGLDTVRYSKHSLDVPARAKKNIGVIVQYTTKRPKTTLGNKFYFALCGCSVYVYDLHFSIIVLHLTMD